MSGLVTKIIHPVFFKFGNQFKMNQSDWQHFHKKKKLIFHKLANKESEKSLVS